MVSVKRSIEVVFLRRRPQSNY
ncbi:hypothetical protein AYI69_g8164, partial [Smittium culicis]